MSVRHSAADLRGLKAKREREIYDGVVSGICSAISHQVIAAATRGDSKFVAILKKGHKYEGVLAMTYINSINGYEIAGSQGYSADLTEGFVGDCILKLQEEFPECVIDGEMEEYTEQKQRIREPPATKTRYTITVDWGEPPAAGATAVEAESAQSELEVLRAKIAELESENARLKSANMCSPAADLLDIFTAFGAITESKTM
jgi:hypothetical protein